MDFDLGAWGKLLAGAAAVALAAAAVYLAAEIPLPDPEKQTVASGTATRRAARPTAKDLRGASPPCSAEGSLGIDALSGCELALADEKPPAAWLRCGSEENLEKTLR